MIFVLFLSALCGGLIGFERDINGHPAGLRTHILVSVGSTLITLVSQHIGDHNLGTADPGRIAAQIVSGIGFLGAGAIIREGMNVKGLTSAASIWSTAGIGMSLSLGSPFIELGLIGTCLVLFTLWLLNYLENWIESRMQRRQYIKICVRDATDAPAKVIQCIAAHSIKTRGIEYRRGRGDHVLEMMFRVNFPIHFSREKLLTDLSLDPNIITVELA